jgi:hypothetical protein
MLGHQGQLDQRVVGPSAHSTAAVSSNNACALVVNEAWNSRRNRDSSGSAAHEVAADGRSLRINGEDGAMPFAFPLTADGWVEQLCRFTDRPFTAEERSLLPGASTSSRPARGRESRTHHDARRNSTVSPDRRHRART